MDPGCGQRAFELRLVGAGDEEFLRALYLADRADEAAVLGEALLAMQFQARQRGYAALFPGATDELVLVDAAPVGRRLVWAEADGLRLVDIALMPSHRGRGLGTAVLGELLARADAQGWPVRCQVAAHNDGARRLYARLGFKPVGQSPPYERLERPVGG